MRQQARIRYLLVWCDAKIQSVILHVWCDAKLQSASYLFDATLSYNPLSTCLMRRQASLQSASYLIDATLSYNPLSIRFMRRQTSICLFPLSPPPCCEITFVQRKPLSGSSTWQDCLFHQHCPPGNGICGRYRKFALVLQIKQLATSDKAWPQTQINVFHVIVFCSTIGLVPIKTCVHLRTRFKGKWRNR